MLYVDENFCLWCIRIKREAISLIDENFIGKQELADRGDINYFLDKKGSHLIILKIEFEVAGSGFIPIITSIVSN